MKSAATRRAGIESSSLLLAAGVLIAVLAWPVVAPSETSRESFEEALSRVDYTLKKNPNFVVSQALETCAARRRFAVQLHRQGQETRAMRSLKYCMRLLKIPEKIVVERVDRSAQIAAERARQRGNAAREVERALALEPNVANGLEIYRGCAACHTPEGWGLASGVVPQLAGQHRNVVIKQLADIRAGNRVNNLMTPYSSVEAIGGTQAVADVAGYIDTLEINVDNGKGDGEDLELGARLYAENCARCHGAKGEGNNEAYQPRIQAQHYNYLVTQFQQIKAGQRRNANAEMVAQIQKFEDREMRAVLDYVSRLEPPKELQAPPGWKNPDFQDTTVLSQSR